MSEIGKTALALLIVMALGLLALALECGRESGRQWLILVGASVALLVLALAFGHAAHARDLLVFSIRHDGKVIWIDPDTFRLPRAQCRRYAKSYGDGVEARCFRKMPR
jgi:hypothetical protein